MNMKRIGIGLVLATIVSLAVVGVAAAEGPVCGPMGCGYYGTNSYDEVNYFISNPIPPGHSGDYYIDQCIDYCRDHGNGNCVDYCIDREAAYDHGYAQGYDQGYDQGYAQGDDQGYGRGYYDGFYYGRGGRCW